MGGVSASLCLSHCWFSKETSFLFSLRWWLKIFYRCLSSKGKDKSPTNSLLFIPMLALQLVFSGVKLGLKHRYLQPSRGVEYGVCKGEALLASLYSIKILAFINKLYDIWFIKSTSFKACSFSHKHQQLSKMGLFTVFQGCAVCLV